MYVLPALLAALGVAVSHPHLERHRNCPLIMVQVMGGSFHELVHQQEAYCAWEAYDGLRLMPESLGLVA